MHLVCTVELLNLVVGSIPMRSPGDRDTVNSSLELVGVDWLIVKPQGMIPGARSDHSIRWRGAVHYARNITMRGYL